MPQRSNWITPNWSAPANVKALSTLRQGGYSVAPYDSFNLAQHVGDDRKAVSANRQQLLDSAGLPQEPLWLSQVHGANVVNVGDYQNSTSLIEADASIALGNNQVCVVLTGDCLPILLCDRKGTRVAAIHAGWRSLAADIIEVAVKKLNCNPSDLIAWLGPAIGQSAYEVKQDFLNAFKDSRSKKAFLPNGYGSWHASLYELARERLNKLDIQDVFGGEYCVYTDSERFYSARRSKITGRMATLIWLSAP